MAVGSTCRLPCTWPLRSAFLSGLQDTILADTEVESDMHMSMEALEEDVQVGLVTPESFAQPTRMWRPMIEDPAVDVVRRILQ